tara:strand:- start:19 stop:357 length:339 start_codon:yes stop_codon:yes gene_type:complete
MEKKNELINGMCGVFDYIQKQETKIKDLKKTIEQLELKFNLLERDYNNLKEENEKLKEEDVIPPLSNVICVLCSRECENEYGNNAQPLVEGRCCDVCNEKKVIPMRVLQIRC